MDKMLDIPVGRKRIRTGRLCVLLGMTVLLFVVALARQGGG